MNYITLLQTKISTKMFSTNIYYPTGLNPEFFTLLTSGFDEQKYKKNLYKFDIPRKTSLILIFTNSFYKNETKI